MRIEELVRIVCRESESARERNRVLQALMDFDRARSVAGGELSADELAAIQRATSWDFADRRAL